MCNGIVFGSHAASPMQAARHKSDQKFATWKLCCLADSKLCSQQTILREQVSTGHMPMVQTDQTHYATHGVPGNELVDYLHTQLELMQ